MLTPASSALTSALPTRPHQATMDRHNSSETAARFYCIAAPLRDGEVTLAKTVELSAKA